jgi:hypothetical protein
MVLDECKIAKRVKHVTWKPPGCVKLKKVSSTDPDPPRSACVCACVCVCVCVCV